MNRSWDTVIEPLLRAVSPSVVVEIGAEHGTNTRNLLERLGPDTVVHSIDPTPTFDVDEWRERYGERFVFHPARSLNVLGGIERPDAVLIDGDHNWYTVFHELKLIEKRAEIDQRPLPIVLLHDVDWPYGRRDLYYDPGAIPAAYRQPHRTQGVRPLSSELVENGGLNRKRENAVYEHDMRNGVRTAVEDFLAGTEMEIEAVWIPGLHGVSILADAAHLSSHPKVAKALKRFRSAKFLAAHCEAVELDRLEAKIRAETAQARAEERKRRLEELKGRLEEAQAELRTLRARETELAGELDEAGKARVGAEAAGGRVVQLETRLAELRGEVQAGEYEQRRLNRQLDELRADFKEAEGQAAELSREVEQRDRDLADRGRDLADARQQAEAAGGRVVQLETRLAELRGEVQAGEYEQRRLNRQLDELRADFKEAEGQAAELSREVEQRDRDLADRGRDLAGVRQQAEQRERRLIALGARLVEAEHREAALTDEVKAGAYEQRRLSRRLDERGLELRNAERQAARLGEVLGDRDVRLAEVRSLVLLAAQDAQRVARSRSWRFGHRLFRVLGRLTFRHRARHGAVDTLIERLEAADFASAGLDVESEGDRPGPGRAEPPPAATPEPEGPLRAERAARDAFSRRYAAAGSGHNGGAPHGELAPPVDRRGMLSSATGTDASGDGLTVDVVVCVHDALEDVHQCLSSVIAKTDRRFGLIMVDDGSGPETRAYLRAFEAANPEVRLIHNDEPPHGYTVAANLGLRAASGDYVVLLNSDTVVTFGWLDRIIECGESDQTIGIVGPLSNAASHQSIPHTRNDNGWAINALPTWLTADAMALLVEAASTRQFPRFPFLNGFCYAIKRPLLEAAGHFDEENFGDGYCEENDYSYRATRAGFELAVADNAYVYHRKSRSYGSDVRNRIARRNYERFNAKHGEHNIAPLVEQLETDASLRELRELLGEVVTDERALVRRFASVCPATLSITFVLAGMSHGSSGGVHSIYQETRGMRDLGIDANVALPVDVWERAAVAYEDADEVFVPFSREAELARIMRRRDVVVGTHFRSVAPIRQLAEEGHAFLPAYYVQDYEPFFLEPGSRGEADAANSYGALPGAALFAKTAWLCELVGRAHGVHVAKVEPSIDHSVYHPRAGVGKPASGLKVAAMVRPRTPRRQPLGTLRVLDRLLTQRDDVEVRVFGSTDEELRRLSPELAERIPNLGILKRDQVAAALADSDVFLDFSFYQAFGRTALEAMACGCVSVVPEAGGASEFAVHEHNALIVDTQREEPAQEAILGLANESERLAALRVNAIATAGRFSVLRAALSEYALLAHRHRRRAEPARAMPVVAP